jgi:hypothetical protein
MYGADRHWNPKDGLTSTGAVWSALTFAGLVAGLQPWRAAQPIFSLLIYAASLAAYARWTGPGRRSVGAYFIAGLLFPVAFVAGLILIFRITDDPGWMLVPIFAGASVGFQFHGGADTPLDAYLPLIWLNVMLPIALVIGARSVIRYGRD